MEMDDYEYDYNFNDIIEYVGGEEEDINYFENIIEDEEEIIEIPKPKSKLNNVKRKCQENVSGSAIKNTTTAAVAIKNTSSVSSSILLKLIQYYQHKKF